MSTFALAHLSIIREPGLLLTMTKDNQTVVLSIAGSDSVGGAGIQVSGLLI
jgi:hypothetical protein